ncbi:MAG TPA: hypothetical protein VFB80_07870 [Pirellulaceae bacterium]|nr:hypothetical protein [Pirellulaceae bacterium]
MNDEIDSLEAELAALAPRDLSPQLAGRIAAELEQEGPAPLRRWRLGQVLAAIAVGAVAASAVAAAWLWRNDQRTAQADSPAAPIALPVATAFDPALPSVWTFRRAADEPAGQLDGLLDRHSGRTRLEQPHYVQIRGFGASDVERNDLLGEL